MQVHQIMNFGNTRCQTQNTNNQQPSYLSKINSSPIRDTISFGMKSSKIDINQIVPKVEALLTKAEELLETQPSLEAKIGKNKLICKKVGIEPANNHWPEVIADTHCLPDNYVIVLTNKKDQPLLQLGWNKSTKLLGIRTPYESAYREVTRLNPNILEDSVSADKKNVKDITNWYNNALKYLTVILPQ